MIEENEIWLDKLSHNQYDFALKLVLFFAYAIVEHPPGEAGWVSIDFGILLAQPDTILDESPLVVG
jgi:hypothetical protein